jgi:hypothetical protein
MAIYLSEVAMYVRHQYMLPELKQQERQERDAKRSKRLRIIILAMRGWTAPAIAMAERERDGVMAGKPTIFTTSQSTKKSYLNHLED